MDQHPQPAASNGLRSRELMRLPAQSRSVSRSRSRSPDNGSDDDDSDEEEFQRRVRAEESRVKIILAKSSRPALAEGMWPAGLPAFDDARAFVGFYRFNGTIEFCPPISWPRYYQCALLDVDLAFMRFALVQEENSPFVISLSKYGSLDRLKHAAFYYYRGFENRPTLHQTYPAPYLQNPAHLIYLVPDDDLSALLKLLDKANGLHLDKSLQLGTLARAAGPETMDPSRLFKLVDAVFASLAQRSPLRNGPLLLDDGQHLTFDALKACALLRVHAHAFQDVRICSDDLFASGRMRYLSGEYYSFDVAGDVTVSDSDAIGFYCGTNDARVVMPRSHLRLMIGMIKEAVFVGSGFRRHLYYHSSPQFINFLHTFILTAEQIADGNLDQFTFQIHGDGFPEITENLVDVREAGRYYFGHHVPVVKLGELLQDVWQIHRSKFYIGGLLTDAVDWGSMPPCYNVYRPADSAATVAAIAPRATAAASDADSS